MTTSLYYQAYFYSITKQKIDIGVTGYLGKAAEEFLYDTLK